MASAREAHPTCFGMAASEDLALRPASTLQQMLHKGDVSPTDVAKACLERIEAYNGALNAIVTRNERILEDARALENSTHPKGPLYGIPIGIKDTTDVAGMRTTYGSPLFANHVPQKDALIVQRLRAAGAVIMGKTNTPEFAVGGATTNAVFGPTRNPWNLQRTPGGSTGGGAAAVASGMIALAEGTDLGGSLRMPASFCGIVGLRPSPGLVPLAPTSHRWGRLSVAGSMARTADDLALFLRATSGPTLESPLGQRIAHPSFCQDLPAGLRLAYCPDVAQIGIQEDIQAVCQNAAEWLAHAAGAVDTLNLDLSAGRKAFGALRGHHLLAVHFHRLGRIGELGANLGGNLQRGLRTSARELAEAERARSAIWRQFRDFFQQYAYLLTPCMAVSPFPIEHDFPKTVAGARMETYYDWFAPTSVLSLTGLPICCVPCGLDAAGLPVGLQIVGRPHDEAGVLAVARVLVRGLPIGLPDLGRTVGQHTWR